MSGNTGEMPDRGFAGPAMDENVAERPWIEIRRKLGPGTYRSYANVYRKPFQVSFYAFGKWRWINRP